MQFYPGEVNILCTNLERSLAFYRDVLGFEEVGADSGAFRLRCGDRHYLLLPFATEPRPVTPYERQPEVSNDLLVDDLSAAVVYLEEKGITFAKPFEPGTPNAIIRDPDGLVWEILDKNL